MDIIQKLAGWAGWGLLAFVTFVTLSPIKMRPHVAAVSIEHFVAFVAVGFLLTSAYPRHILLVLAFVVGAAIVLELSQLLTPDRHGRVHDALIKVAGGLGGVLTALLIQWGVKYAGYT